MIGPISDELRATANTAIRRARRQQRRKVDAELLANLVSGADIARRLGVTRPAVANWSARGLGFPEPVIRLKYDWREVSEWLRVTGRIKSIGVRFLVNLTPPAVSKPVDDPRFPRRPWRP